MPAKTGRKRMEHTELFLMKGMGIMGLMGIMGFMDKSPFNLKSLLNPEMKTEIERSPIVLLEGLDVKAGACRHAQAHEFAIG